MLIKIRYPNDNLHDFLCLNLGKKKFFTSTAPLFTKVYIWVIDQV